MKDNAQENGGKALFCIIDAWCVEINSRANIPLIFNFSKFIIFALMRVFENITHKFAIAQWKLTVSGKVEWVFQEDASNLCWVGQWRNVTSPS